MHQSWDHVAVLEIEVIGGAEYVCGDDTGEHAAILLVICSAGGTEIWSHWGIVRMTFVLVGYVDDSLGVGVTVVGIVRFPIVYLVGTRREDR